MTPALPPLPFSPARLRSYILRLPLFTRIILLAIVVFWVLDLQPAWSVAQWGQLKPSQVTLLNSRCIPVSLRRSLSKFLCLRGAFCVFSSVSAEHIPLGSPRVSTHAVEFVGADAVAGEI